MITSEDRIMQRVIITLIKNKEVIFHLLPGCLTDISVHTFGLLFLVLSFFFFLFFAQVPVSAVACFWTNFYSESL